MQMGNRLPALPYKYWCFLITALATVVWAQEPPRWVNRVGEDCPPENLCALGQGTGYQVAAAHARKELAKVFGTQVIAKFQMTTTYGGKTTEELVREDLAELTEQVLEGVQITRRHREDDGIYVLAVLDRRRAGERIRQAIKERDQRLQSYLQTSKLSALLQLRKLYNQRATLNGRYQLLRGHLVPEQVTWEQIIRRQKAVAAQGRVIHISIAEESPGFIHPLLVQLLTRVGFRIADKNFQQRLQGRYSAQRLPLNIEGFEKYRFTLGLKTLNDQGQEIGGLNFHREVTGRNKAQATSKARAFVRDYLLEHIDQLNI